jgi:hypothetical protein
MIPPIRPAGKLLQQDSTILLGLRQSLTDEQVDIKKISSQLSTLIAKQHAIAPEIFGFSGGVDASRGTRRTTGVRRSGAGETAELPAARSCQSRFGTSVL